MILGPVESFFKGVVELVEGLLPRTRGECEDRSPVGDLLPVGMDRAKASEGCGKGDDEVEAEFGVVKRREEADDGALGWFVVDMASESGVS